MEFLTVRARVLHAFKYLGLSVAKLYLTQASEKGLSKYIFLALERQLEYTY